MSFESPWLLLCLLVVPAAIVGYLVLERRRAHRAEQWSSAALIPNMVPSRPGFRRYVPLVFFLIALVLLLAGFARPQANVNTPREGATVVLAVDISGSMDAKDVNNLNGPGRTTRLLAARDAAASFLKELPDRYRVSLVLFGNRGIVKVAPTYDRQKILAALPTKSKTEGTALASGIDSTITVAQRAFGKPEEGQKPNPVVALLISDGGNTAPADPAASVAKARKLGLPISTVLLGTSGQLAVIDQKIPGGTNHVQVPVQADQLQKIARGTDGTFFQVHSAGELKQVYENLGSRLVQDKKKREITVVAGAAGIAFMVAGALLSGIWFRRIV